MTQPVRTRIAAGLLTLSAGAFATWKASEGFSDVAIIPTAGDVPTLGHGSTRYEDGSRVKMGDHITPERAVVLARNLASADEKSLAAALPGVKLYQEEFDTYLDFVGQYGIGRFRASSIRTNLLAGRYGQACDALLLYKFSAGYDCSTPGNRVCAGVWTRQLKRHTACMEAQ